MISDNCVGIIVNSGVAWYPWSLVWLVVDAVQDSGH